MHDLTKPLLVSLAFGCRSIETLPDPARTPFGVYLRYPHGEWVTVRRHPRRPGQASWHTVPREQLPKATRLLLLISEIPP